MDKQRLKDILTPFGFIMMVIGFWAMDFALNSYFLGNAKTASISEVIIEKPKNEKETIIPEITISAKSSISVMISNQGSEDVLFADNEEKKLPVASLVKLMTALITLEEYDLASTIVVPKPDSESEVSENIKEGEILSVKNLLNMILIESNNGAAEILSNIMGKEKFISKMNERAVELSMLNTHFEDSSGLNPKSYSTAKDMVKLSRHLFKNYPLFREIISYREYKLFTPAGIFHHTLQNTNKLVGQEPNIAGGKTGWTEEAKGCLMVFQVKSKGDGYLIHVILGADDRFGEMKKLIINQ